MRYYYFLFDLFLRDINFNKSGATTSKIKRNLDTSQNYLLFQSSWHMETVAKWMTVFPHFLFNAIKSKTRIIHVGLFWTKTTLKRGGEEVFSFRSF